jgi:hypothetical protein
MKKRIRGREKMTKTIKTAIGTVGREKQKLLIFEKKIRKCVFVYLFIHLFISFMVKIRCILELDQVSLPVLTQT